MDGFIIRQVLVEWVRDIDWTVLHTGITPRAFIFYDVSGFFDQTDPEISCFPFHTVHFGIGHDLYIGMSGAFNELGGFNTHGAIIGGEGLIKLSHLSADGRRFIDQVDLKPRLSQVKCSLYTTDSSAYDHDIAVIVFFGIAVHLSFIWFFFQFFPSSILLLRYLHSVHLQRNIS